MSQSPRWMSVVLVLAGIYNLSWGAWAVLFPINPLLTRVYSIPTSRCTIRNCGSASG